MAMGNPLQMKDLMGTSSVHGGFPIATFNCQRVSQMGWNDFDWLWNHGDETHSSWQSGPIREYPKVVGVFPKCIHIYIYVYIIYI